MKSLTKILFAFLLMAGVSQAFADTQNRRVTGFNGITLSCSADLYITQGSSESVRVEAPADVIDKIKTDVEGGVLKIYTKDSWNWNWGNVFGGHKKIAVYVTAKDLNSIGVSGSGDVYFRDGINANSMRLKVSGSGDLSGRLEAKDVQISVSGSGDIKLSGHANTATIGVSGSGDFSGRDFVTQSTSVRVSGSGDASVNANDRIDASVSGSGDIRYSGAAKSVSTSKSGSGEVHRN